MEMKFFATGRSRSQPWFADVRKPYDMAAQLREQHEARERDKWRFEPISSPNYFPNWFYGYSSFDYFPTAMPKREMKFLTWESPKSSIVEMVKAKLKKISYRPSYTFELTWDFLGQVHRIQMTGMVIDAYNHKAPMLPAYLSSQSLDVQTMEELAVRDDLFLETMHDLVKTWELHEAGEFLMYDGKRPFDPHRDDPSPPPPTVIYDLREPEP